MRSLKIIAATAAAVATVGLTAAPAEAYPGGCSVYYSGTDARASCSYTSIPYLSSSLYMDVTGYAFATVTCSGLQVVSSGVVGSGTYRFNFINPGGTCVLRTGVNGTLYASAN